jgi:hypothetical protein
MPKSPYRIARQEHLGNMLDQLQGLGLLTWEWGYENHSAVYWIAEIGHQRRKFDTRRAELLALKLCEQQGIVWLPVPHPGGEVQLAVTLRNIEDLKRGGSGSETSTEATIEPIEPESFEITAYPLLGERLRDEPGHNRSAQTFGVARTCIELGLSDGQMKWLLAQYPPFLDKYAGRRGDADRELDRVITRAREDRD